MASCVRRPRARLDDFLCLTDSHVPLASHVSCQHSYPQPQASGTHLDHRPTEQWRSDPDVADDWWGGNEDVKDGQSFHCVCRRGLVTAD